MCDDGQPVQFIKLKIVQLQQTERKEYLPVALNSLGSPYIFVKTKVWFVPCKTKIWHLQKAEPKETVTCTESTHLIFPPWAGLQRAIKEPAKYSTLSISNYLEHQQHIQSLLIIQLDVKYLQVEPYQ